MIPQSEWKWFGYPQHFICAERCRFHMATRVGDYLISTVGQFFVNEKDEKPRPMGAGPHLFETYVFSGPMEPCEEGCCVRPKEMCEIDGLRTMTAVEAQATHMDFCLKYAAMQETDR